MSVIETRKSFATWSTEMMRSIHNKGYLAPAVKRIYIPKPGKSAKRPIGIPTVADRALQKTTSDLLNAIYEQDFLACSYGGRPKKGAHQALSTLHMAISARKVGWVLEADLKNFFGSLDHGWIIRFIELRVGGARRGIPESSP